MATAIGEREGGAKSGDKENNSNSENANKMSVLAKGESSTDMFTGAFASGSVIGGAAGLLLQLRAGSGAFEWKAVPYSMARGALAFGSALGIYEATNCKLKQTGVSKGDTQKFCQICSNWWSLLWSGICNSVKIFS